MNDHDGLTEDVTRIELYYCEKLNNFHDIISLVPCFLRTYRILQHFMDKLKSRHLQNLHNNGIHPHKSMSGGC